MIGAQKKLLVQSFGAIIVLIFIGSEKDVFLELFLVELLQS